MYGLEDRRARNRQSRRKKAAAILNRNSGGPWVLVTQKRPSMNKLSAGIWRQRNLP